MKCIKCNKEIDNDSKFCTYCGAKVITKKEVEKRKHFYDNDYEDNKYSDRCRNLFFIGFFALDLVLATIIGYLGIPNIWIYVVSAFVYIAAIIFGIKGIGFSLSLKKKGKNASGLFSSIVLSLTCLVIMIVNISTVIGLF